MRARFIGPVREKPSRSIADKKFLENQQIQETPMLMTGDLQHSFRARTGPRTGY
jgi:hypothetical protein